MSKQSTLGIIILLFTGHATALSIPLPPLPPLDWEAEVDPRFDPPVEWVVVEAKWPLEEDVLHGYWQSWGPEALDLLQHMMNAPRWRDYQFKIAKIFYACPIEGAEVILQAELVRRADAAAKAEPLDPLNPAHTFNQHLWAIAATSPASLTGLLQHENDWIRLQAASALIRREKCIPPSVESVVMDFSNSDTSRGRKFALSLLREAPSEENDARAAELAESIAALEIREAAELESRLHASSEPGLIRGVVVNEQGEPQHGLLVAARLTDFRTGGSAGNAEVATGADGTFEMSVNPGIAKIHEVRIRRLYEFSRHSDRPAEKCKLLEPVPPFEVFPGSTIEGFRLIVDVPEPSFITGTIVDDAGEPLKASVNVLIEDELSSGSSHYMVSTGSFIFYALPQIPFAIEFRLEGHQARILQVGRDFYTGDRDIEVVLPSTPYPEDVPIWTTITGTPWTQNAVDASVQGTMIRHRLDSFAKI